MILTEKIEITLNPANMKHFYCLGYKKLKKDEFELYKNKVYRLTKKQKRIIKFLEWI